MQRNHPKISADMRPTVDGLDDVYDCEEATTIGLASLKPGQPAVVITNEREWDVDDQQGLLRARLVGGE